MTINPISIFFKTGLFCTNTMPTIRLMNKTIGRNTESNRSNGKKSDPNNTQIWLIRKSSNL